MSDETRCGYGPGCGTKHDYARCFWPPPLSDGGAALTREEYEEALSDYRRGLIQFTPERKEKLLAHDAALRAEVERLKADLAAMEGKPTTAD